MNTSDSLKSDPKERLIRSAITLFSEKGFAGASIRRICEHAGTSMNMIHHYFGNKEGLYQAILDRFSSNIFVVPMRIIDMDPETCEEFCTRFSLFVEESLESLITHQELFRLIVREKVTFEVFVDYSKQLVAFLDRAKERGFLRPALDAGMLSGLVMDRLTNQILFGDLIEGYFGYNISSNQEYKKRWVKANIDLFLNGMLAK